MFQPDELDDEEREEVEPSEEDIEEGETLEELELDENGHVRPAGRLWNEDQDSYDD